MSFFLFLRPKKSSAYAKIRIDDEKKAFDGPFFSFGEARSAVFQLISGLTQMELGTT